MAKTKFEYRLFISEAVGTGLLLFFGLSVVIFNWGEGTIVEMLIPSHGLRSAITGFLFGTVGCLVTISPVEICTPIDVDATATPARALRAAATRSASAISLT